MRLLVIPMMLAALVLPLAPSNATNPAGPYSRGRVCVDYPGYGSRYSCYTNPPPNGYAPSNYELGAPLNIGAELARQGVLTVGGKETLGPIGPFYNPLVNIRTAASIIDFDSPSSTSTVTVRANVSVIDVSSPYYIGLYLCLRLVDNGPVSGYYPPPSGPIASVCVRDGAEWWLTGTSSLTTTGIVGVVNGIARKLSAYVELDNTVNDGGGSANVITFEYAISLP
ncbi:MAG: hypothetical protein ABR507_03720 [Actinomycetota bacterium]